MTDHPEPRQRALEVEVTDSRVPRAAALMAASVPTSAGWSASLEYACGNTLIGKEGAPGPLLETVVLRVQRFSRVQGAVAFWITAALAVCPLCSGSFTPTKLGKFRLHKVEGEDCDGSGTPAILRDTEPGESAYAFGSAYVMMAPRRWLRASSAELRNFLLTRH